MPTMTQKPPRTQTEEKLLPQKPKKSKSKRALLLCTLALLVIAGALLGFFLKGGPLSAPGGENFPAGESTPGGGKKDPSGVVVPTWVDVQLIEIDGESRRGEKLEAVRDLAVHYVGNPGTSAQANRNWFANPESTTSSHFIVGLEGEVIQCVPLDEKSSATNERNRDTISIEVCHPDETGKFSDVTMESLLRLLAWLCNEYDLGKENIIRHYDVTGKMCPLYYVENEAEWKRLKDRVEIKRKEESWK